MTMSEPEEVAGWLVTYTEVQPAIKQTLTERIERDISVVKFWSPDGIYIGGGSRPFTTHLADAKAKVSANLKKEIAAARERIAEDEAELAQLEAQLAALDLVQEPDKLGA